MFINPSLIMAITVMIISNFDYIININHKKNVDDNWLKHEPCRLFKPSVYINKLTPIQYIEYDYRNRLIQLKLFNIHRQIIKLTLSDTIEYDRPPFRLNLCYSYVANLDDTDEMKKFKLMNNLNKSKNEWLNDNVKITSRKNEIHSSMNQLKFYWNLQFVSINNSSSFDLCEWKFDKYYWFVEHNSLKNCTKVKFYSPILLAVIYQSYIYLFSNNFIVIIPKRIIAMIDNNQQRHKEQLVRFTKKSLNKFFICPHESLWQRFMRYNRKHQFLIGIYAIVSILFIILCQKLINLFRINLSKQKLIKNRINNLRYEKQQQKSEMMEYLDQDFDPEDDDSILSSLTSEHLTLIFQNNNASNDDKLPRAIPIMYERPKFKLIHMPKPKDC